MIKEMVSIYETLSFWLVDCDTSAELVDYFNVDVVPTMLIVPLKGDDNIVVPSITPDQLISNV